MRLLRKSKLIFLGFTLFFFGYFTINYVALRKEKALAKIVSAIEEPQHLKQKLSDHSSKEVIKSSTDLKETNSVKKRFYAYDGGGFGSINSGITTCLRDNNEVEVINRSLKKVDIVYFGVSVPRDVDEIKSSDRPKYSMVFALESEVHSYGGDTWNRADFRMYYSLDKSFPEPATYFDVKVHLADLLTPPKVTFANKITDAPIVWIVSNCNAFNG